MLRMQASYSADQAKGYYTESLNRGDYYHDGQEMPGRWAGKLAARLGLSGEVKQREFFALCDNVHPAESTQLTPRTKIGRRVGYDINFHVPKSVSLLYGLVQDTRILGAFRDAVNGAMTELEERMHTRVRVDGQKSDRLTGTAVWGEFIHATARPVNGTPDPHLHAHCFTFNMTYDAVEKRLKAGEFSEMKREAPLYQARFLLHLAHGMHSLGYDIVQKGKSWEVAGMSDRLITEFSRRTAEVNRVAKELGIENDPLRKASLGARTREQRNKGQTLTELRVDWRTRSGDEGWKDCAAAFAKAKSRSGRKPDRADKAARDAVAHAVSHVFERKSAVPEHELLEAACIQGIGKTTLDAIDAAFAKEQLIRRKFEGKTWVTTPQVLGEEEHMLAFCAGTRGRCSRIVDGVYEPKDKSLNTGQKAAVRHVLNSYDQVMLIRGGAGTGKTRLMQEAITATTSAGLKVAVLSPLSNVARQTLPKEGFREAETVAKFLNSKDLQQQYRNGLLWIDEAGLLGVRTVNQLLSVAESMACRVVLSGDPSQHKPVERGDAIRILVEEAGMQSAEVSTVMRQTGEYKKACEQLNRGEIQGGWKTLEKMQSIVECKGKSGIADCHKRLAAEYARLASAGKSVHAVSPTHAEGGLIREAIRAELQKKGMVSKHNREFERLKPLHLTTAQKQDAGNYKPGMIVQFHAKSRGKKAGERGEVMSVVKGNVFIKGALGTVTPLALKLKDASKFAIFEKDTIAIAVGDLIRVTSNGRAVGDLIGFLPDRKNPLRNGRQLLREVTDSLKITKKQFRPNPKRLNNGSVYRVIGFVPLSGDIILNNGYVVDRKYGHLTHGYCSTSPDAQSKTVDHILVGQTSMSFGPASNAEQILVSVSRGRFGCSIFTDDRETLFDEIHKKGSRLSAKELVSRSDAEILNAQREHEQTEKLRQEQDRLKDERAMKEGREHERTD